MKIYFVRHGESTENAHKLVDPIESNLTDNGIKQAELVSQRLKNHKIEMIFCSNTVRAKQTAEIINKHHKVEIEETKLIGELLPPTFMWGKKEIEPEVAETFKLLNENIHNKDFRHSDEENFHDLKTRVFKFLDDLSKKEFENVLVIGHGYVLRCLLGKIIFGDEYSSHDFVKLRDRIKTTNTGITVCEFTNDSGWTLTTWNDDSHL